MEIPEVLTSAEAAKALGYKIKYLQRMAAQGKIPHTKVFGQYRFLAQDIHDIIYKNYRR